MNEVPKVDLGIQAELYLQNPDLQATGIAGLQDMMQVLELAAQTLSPEGEGLATQRVTLAQALDLVNLLSQNQQDFQR